MIKETSTFGNKKNPKQLVVLLHGFGSNKDDLISLAPYFARVMPEALFVSPNAPNTCDFVMDGYSWFSLNGVDLNNTSYIPEKTKQELASSINILNDFIDDTLKKYNINEKNLYLMGFSQGATMSLYTSLKRKTPVKTVLAYSGIFFDNPEVVSKPKIIGIAHGKLDDVVPFIWHDKNTSILNKENLKFKEIVSEYAYHEITPEAIDFGVNILKESL